MSEVMIPTKGNVPASPTSTNLETFFATTRKLKDCLFSLEAAEQFALRLPEIEPQVAAMRRPITVQELSFELGKILCAFPNGKADEDFADAMVDNIMAMRPSIGAVWLARYTLVSKNKFRRNRRPNNASHPGAAAGDKLHSHRYGGGQRSRRARLRFELSASGREHYRLHVHARSAARENALRASQPVRLGSSS